MRFPLTSLSLNMVATETSAQGNAGTKRRGRICRLACEFGLGLLGEGLALLACYAILLWGDRFDSSLRGWLLFLLLILLFLGASALAVLGVYFGGKLSGGRGHLGWPMFVSAGLVCLGAAYGQTLLIEAHCHGLHHPCDDAVGWQIALWALPLLPLICAMIAYEISDRSVSRWELEDDHVKGETERPEPV